MNGGEEILICAKKILCATTATTRTTAMDTLRAAGKRRGRARAHTGTGCWRAVAGMGDCGFGGGGRDRGREGGRAKERRRTRYQRNGSTKREKEREREREAAAFRWGICRLSKCGGGQADADADGRTDGLRTGSLASDRNYARSANAADATGKCLNNSFKFSS